MALFRNLISDSYLINETVEFLISTGGCAPIVKVVDRVMKISEPEPAIARLLVNDLVERDSRLAIADDLLYLNGRDETLIELSKCGFVVIDLETTGAKAPPCRVTEVGAIRIESGAITDEFRTLVNPEIPIPAFITSLTGISDDMVSDAPRFCEIADDLLRFIGDSIIVAHNARFDISFLNYEIGRVYEDCRLGNASLCTVQLSRRLLPDIENHKLNTVARFYSIDLFNHHRAGDDARATAGIFLNLLEGLKMHGVYNLAAARRFGSKQNYA